MLAEIDLFAFIINSAARAGDVTGPGSDKHSSHLETVMKGPPACVTVCVCVCVCCVWCVGWCVCVCVYVCVCVCVCVFQSTVAVLMGAGVRRVVAVIVLSSRLWEIAVRSVSHSYTH